jgi:hypothetical protein
VHEEVQPFTRTQPYDAKHQFIIPSPTETLIRPHLVRTRFVAALSRPFDMFRSPLQTLKKLVLCGNESGVTSGNTGRTSNQTGISAGMKIYLSSPESLSTTLPLLSLNYTDSLLGFRLTPLGPDSGVSRGLSVYQCSRGYCHIPSGPDSAPIVTGPHVTISRR